MLIKALNLGSVSATKKAWEKDLNLASHEDEWGVICKNIKIMLRDARVRLI